MPRGRFFSEWSIHDFGRGSGSSATVASGSMARSVVARAPRGGGSHGFRGGDRSAAAGHEGLRIILGERVVGRWPDAADRAGARPLSSHLLLGRAGLAVLAA